MSDFAIRIDNLGKQYRLGQIEPYKTLRDTIANAGRRLMHRMTRPREAADRGTFWALKDVSFEVKRGEVVGIIGRNGAGKSTLLKILSRITEPTTGEVELRGRVGSLLEVGTGFHPELTGRENIYLNGAILGMTRAEITRRFDEIVDFAGIEKFLDTPVKRYSSGMYVRLAFAVAAHLEPEILIVDEVLAVGDAEFQKKCLGRMSQVASEGRTVLFVSHNMAAVEALCRRAVLLDAGAIKDSGSASRVISTYFSADRNRTETIAPAERRDRRGNGAVTLSAISIKGDPDPVVCGGRAVFNLTCVSHEGAVIRDLDVTITVLDDAGVRLFSCRTKHTLGSFQQAPSGATIRCAVPSLPVIPGIYSIDVRLACNEEETDRIENAGRMSVFEADYFGSGRLPHRGRHGPILVRHEWQLLP